MQDDRTNFLNRVKVAALATLVISVYQQISNDRPKSLFITNSTIVELITNDN